MRLLEKDLRKKELELHNFEDNILNIEKKLKTEKIDFDKFKQIILSKERYSSFGSLKRPWG